MPRLCRRSFRNAALRSTYGFRRSPLYLIVRMFALEERHSRCLNRHRTARYRLKSRCPETAGGARCQERYAGQLPRLPAHPRSGRHARPTAPGNRRRNIHWQSKVGRGLLRGRTGCFHNGPGWSAPPRSSFRRTARQLLTEWKESCGSGCQSNGGDTIKDG